VSAIRNTAEYEIPGVLDAILGRYLMPTAALPRPEHPRTYLSATFQ
jgi:hypothetical protein